MPPLPTMVLMYAMCPPESTEPMPRRSRRSRGRTSRPAGGRSVSGLNTLERDECDQRRTRNDGDRCAVMVAAWSRPRHRQARILSMKATAEGGRTMCRDGSDPGGLGSWRSDDARPRSSTGAKAPTVISKMTKDDLHEALTSVSDQGPMSNRRRCIGRPRAVSVHVLARSLGDVFAKPRSWPSLGGEVAKIRPPCGARRR